MPTRPVKTRGLTHVALAVRDPQRSLQFYQAVLGVVPVYEQDDFVQAQTPGSWDVLVFERKPAHAGKVGGIAHFGFRLQRPADIVRAKAAVQEAGGTIRDHGEFVPGEPLHVFHRSRWLRGRDLVRTAYSSRSASHHAATCSLSLTTTIDRSP
jgi:catechol 2,3-dioxygenase-like lactoylglutathione lyase family enzyme